MTPFNALPSSAIIAALRKSRAWITAGALLALVAGFAFFGTGPTHAQGEDSDYVDVGLVLEYPSATSGRFLHMTVMNHGTRTAYDVEVVVEILYPESSSLFSAAPAVPVGHASLENDGYSLRWTIPELKGLTRVEDVSAQIRSTTYDENNVAIFDKSLDPHEVFGEVTTASFESDLRKDNNTDGLWFVATALNANTNREEGAYSINSVSVDEPNPSPGDIVNFTIVADMDSDIDNKIAIKLTNGLAVDEDANADPPRVVSLDPIPTDHSPGSYSNRVITFGKRKLDDQLLTHSATLPVRVASDAIVNEQCLTATITGLPAPGAGPYNDDISDNVATVCLGDPVEPFASGQVDALTVYPCVGDTDAPCDSTDDIRVRAAHPASGTPLTSGAAVFWLEPLKARIYDGHTNTSNELQSVNDGTTISWQTAVSAGRTYTGGGNVWCRTLLLQNSLHRNNWLGRPHLRDCGPGCGRKQPATGKGVLA